MQEKFKDVIIEGREFRIGRLTASTGNWIINSLGAAKSDEKLFRSIQGYIFEACNWLKDVDGKKIPMPIFSRPEKWMIADLQDDLIVVTELFEAAMEFNFSAFFDKLAAKSRVADSQSEA